MKKIILFLPLLLLIGCTNKVEEDKYAYLEYKSELQKQETFYSDEEIDFNTYFNIVREDEEIVNYSITINNPKIDMYNIKALLIHNYTQDDIFPSVGIFDEEVNLKKDSEDKIILKGKIQTIDDISDVKFKLYIEYTDSENNENKIYYEVSRG